MAMTTTAARSDLKVGATSSGSFVPDDPSKPLMAGMNDATSDGIRSLYERSEFCDVSFIFQDGTMKAHKAMLAAMSGNFCKYISYASKVGTQAGAANPPEDPMKGMFSLPQQQVPTSPQGGDASTNNGATVAEDPSAATPTQASGQEATAPTVSGTASVSGTSPAPPAGTVAAATGAPPAVGAKANESTTPRSPYRLDLHVTGVTHSEAFKILLAYVYEVGTGKDWTYAPSSGEVNKDVLRLAKQFDIQRLHEYAARWLATGLTTANVVDRLVTCEAFGLDKLRERIIEHLAAHPQELTLVTQSPGIMQHPHILQALLMQMALAQKKQLELDTAKEMAASEKAAEQMEQAKPESTNQTEEEQDEEQPVKQQKPVSKQASKNAPPVEEEEEEEEEPAPRQKPAAKLGKNAPVANPPKKQPPPPQAPQAKRAKRG